MNPNQAVTVYLVIPPNKVQDAIPLVRIFINYALDRNMEEMNFDKNKNKQRCLFLLDEFPQLGRIEKMETAMAIMAGYGLKTLFIAQDINQVNKNYSKDNSIISNCHIRIFFAPNEIETAENICKMLGKQTIEVANKSQSGAFNTSKSWNQTGRELLTPDEIMKMSKDEAIVLVAGFAPIKVKKAWYFKCPYFMSRTQNSNYPNALGENPMKSDTVTIIDSYDSLYKINGIKIKDNNDIKNEQLINVEDNIMEHIDNKKKQVIHDGYSNSVAENKDDTPINNLPEDTDESIDIDNIMKESSNPIIVDDTPINNLPEGIDESIDNIIKPSFNSINVDSDEKSVRNEVILLLKRMYSLNEDNAIKLLKRIDDIVIENKKREKLNYELKQKLKENLDIISKFNNNLKKAI